MRVERLFAILLYLLNHERVQAKELAAVFEVTKRTIYRDLESLEQAGIPLVSFPGKQGGYAIIDTFTMTKVTFTESEKELLIQCLKLQDHLIDTDMTNILQQKIALLQTGSSQKAAYTFKDISYYDSPIDNLIKQRWQQLAEIIKMNYQAELIYVSNSGEQTKRVIEPIELVFSKGSWYLRAFCLKRNAERIFKLTRILKITEIAKIKAKIKTSDIPVLKYEIEKSELAKVIFSKKVRARLYDYFLPEQLIEVDEQHISLEFTIDRYQPPYEFLFMFNGALEIIEPKWLREGYFKIIENILESRHTVVNK